MFEVDSHILQVQHPPFDTAITSKAAVQAGAPSFCLVRQPKLITAAIVRQIPAQVRR